MSNYQKVRAFQKAMGQDLDKDWKLFSDLENLRTTLIEEEVTEFLEARTFEDTLKELGDILYVVYGYFAAFGIDADQVFDRIHQSNMSKLDENGNPIYREDGKVMKGPNYTPPNLKDLI